MPGLKDHWNAAYASGDDSLSWRQKETPHSLGLIRSISEPADSVVDIGGGSSSLAAELLADGYRDVTVLDISDTGLAIARERLGDRAADVDWIATDLLDWSPARSFGVWHDRAVIHFLTDAKDRLRYSELLHDCVEAGGHAVIGAFAEDGPEQCSGLPVRRHTHEDIGELLGDDFESISAARQIHVTPSGNQQPFNWVIARRLG
ncbi:MAG: class I SAM-dependent methyltransferase [Actinobacteria bacterium]|nr:class I SAM-dependent methyltransferase [Actinomycetota bacterium]